MRPAWLLCGLVLFGGPVLLLADALTQPLFELQIATIEREGVDAADLRLELFSGEDSLALQASVETLRLPGLDGPLTGLSLDCPVAYVSWPAIACDKALLVITESPWGPQRVEVSLDWRSADFWQLGFSGFRYAGDSLGGQLEMANGDWRLDARAGALRLERLPPFSDLRKQLGLETLAGRLGMKLGLRGSSDGVAKVQLSGQLKALSWADEAGLQAAENLRASFDVTATSRGGDWQANGRLGLLAGEVYSDPVFLDLKANPLRLDLQGDWRPVSKRLELTRVHLDGGDLLSLRGGMVLDFHAGTLRDADLQAELRKLDDTYRVLFQPLLIGTPMDDLEVAGSLRAGLTWRNGEPTVLDASIDRLDLDHRGGSFGAYGVKSAIHWRAGGDPLPSQLGFESAHLGAMAFGAAAADFVVTGSQAWLLEPLSVPFYGGAVALRELRWDGGGELIEAAFSLAVEDVSLEALSKALGWPAMSGRINAELPNGTLVGDTFQVRNDFEIRAFDGRLLLRGLRLSQLTSAAPVMHAELTFEDLDLAKVTETFSFGTIRGRLNGDVRDLELVGWEPNRFSAHFYTPRDDDLPHRISQRAVEDLTELGNGVSGALSGPFLRFFKEFSYDRVELRVEQRGDRAEIDGIPHKDGGFYLVKGAGIPRIDVIGRNREVAWRDLVERLKSIRVDKVEVR